MSFNMDDFTTGMNFGIYDSRYHFTAKGGFSFRPVAVRVLVEQESQLFRQYWERRYFFSLCLEKDFRLIEMRRGFFTGPSAGLTAYYSFGAYRGSNSHPDPVFIPAPFAGWFWSNPWWRISLDYRYQNLHTEYIDPGRISLTFGMLIPMQKPAILQKSIDWLNN